MVLNKFILDFKYIKARKLVNFLSQGFKDNLQPIKL